MGKVKFALKCFFIFVLILPCCVLIQSLSFLPIKKLMKSYINK